MSRDPVDSLVTIAKKLSKGAIEDAAAVAQRELPLRPPPPKPRKVAEYERLRMLLDRGFLDAYTGRRLVYPGALKLISTLLPDEIPYHSHWKTGEGHQVYWSLFPTVDHIVAVTAGGHSIRENLQITSQAMNSDKQNATLEEVGLKIQRSGELEEWDGLLKFFYRYCCDRPEVLKIRALAEWCRPIGRLAKERDETAQKLRRHLEISC